jgi:hypothetical protein
MEIVLIGFGTVTKATRLLLRAQKEANDSERRGRWRFGGAPLGQQCTMQQDLRGGHSVQFMMPFVLEKEG